jgi:hypothetical protein
MVRLVCGPDGDDGPAEDSGTPSLERGELDSFDVFDGEAGSGFGSDERDESESGELRESSFDESCMAVSQRQCYGIIVGTRAGTNFSAVRSPSAPLR